MSTAVIAEPKQIDPVFGRRSTDETRGMDLSHLPVERAVTKLIEYAASISASDLFLVCDDRKVIAKVRHLGHIEPVSTISAEFGRKLISHIRANAGMEITDKKRPLDGRWIYRQEDAPTIDLRINLIPTIHGDDLAIRLLVRESALMSLDNLGLLSQQQAQLSNLLESPSGLILMTGPTGSGKTATLYACLMKLNTGRRKINTIEDPIEFALEGLHQSQINPAIDLGFSELLKSVLRQSPDVIMIGEIRDPDTADTAVRAANSGHLVLATIHAPAAAGAVQSMRALGIHPHFLSTALRGIVSQRLVRGLCPRCKVAFDIAHAPHTFDDVRQWLPPEDGLTLFAPRGCELCNDAGYSSRTGVFEVLPISRAMRDLISDNRHTDQLRCRAAEEKLIEFRHAAMLKVAEGQTSIEEVLRVIPSEQLLLEE